MLPALADPGEDIGCLLLVEDNEGDAEYIAALLAHEQVDIVHVETLTAAVATLEEEQRAAVDAILLDLRLPDGLGIECVDTIREVAPDTPVIVLTGLDDQILALRCLAAGAQDYISKNELRSYNLTRVIRYAVARAREVYARSRADQLEALLNDLANSSEDAIVSGTADGLVTGWNAAAERLFGLAADEAIGRRLADVARSLDGSVGRRAGDDLALALRGEPGSSREIVWERLDGSRVNIQIMAFGLRDDDGRIGHFGAICRDVTEKRAQEARLREQHEALLLRDQQMRALTARLNNVREDEQRRISREVHDELGQLLMGLRMSLHWLGRHVAEGPADLALLAEKVGEADEMVDSTVEAVQRIAAELRPSALDVAGLAAAISGEAYRFEVRTGIEVICEIDDAVPPPPEVATGFFRIFQEMMTNVARHAGASRVWVTFSVDAEQWHLTVRDDGRGFPPGAEDMSSLGLLGMCERAEILHGRLEIDRSVASGACIAAHIPRGAGPPAMA